MKPVLGLISYFLTTVTPFGLVEVTGFLVELPVRAPLEGCIKS